MMTLRMRFSLLPSLFMLFHLLACGVTVQAEPLKMNLSHQKFILDNGLTVIVHEDRKAPIVAVNLWYHVGSKDEKPGKTGFAHLFEHLMFNGSEHHDDEYFKPFERVGATEMNGTTNNDRTNYFQNVPTSALDLALWMESDRMGHLLGAITQAKLDEQRGVVQNEKRQGENQPYGRVFEAITKACYPAGHPYSWEVIGSMTDLNAATLDDVHQWFKDYYGPSNAVLVLAGDIDLETAKQKVQHYFGDIAPGQPITRPKAWTAQRTGHQREVMQDRVPQPRLHQVWNVPELRDQNAPLFDLLGQLLAGGKNSRLYQRLVYRDQIATEVSAAYWGRELSGLFVITADVKKGHTLAEVEKAIDQELTTLLTQGPGQSELERVRAAYTAQFVREAERVGGTGGKSDLLASGEVFFDNPTAMVDIWLKQINAATPIALRDLSRKWLSDGRYTLEVEPFPTLEAAKEGADRSQLPVVDEPPQLKIPELERATLKNGLKVVLAQRHEVPLVQLTLQFDAGHSTDQGGKPGTQSFAMEMLTEGSSQYDALALADRLERLGATLTTSSTIDTSSLHLSTLKSNLTSSLGLFADVLLNPAFKSSEIERKRALWLARIEQEEASPVSLAMRLMPPLLYGEGHPYALPFTGSGTVAGVSSLKRDDLVNFHRTWFQPGRATLIVVGDTTLKELVPLLEQQLGQWRDRGAKQPVRTIPTVQSPTQTRVYLIDKPGSIQSTIFAGDLLTPGGGDDEIAVDLMNQILGGTFTSRLNMNLREDKHWSYGARSLVVDASGQRPFLAYSSVQTDQTAPAMAEILNEVRVLTGQNPPNGAEINKVKRFETLKLPGKYETGAALGGAIADLVRFKRAESYITDYPGRVSDTSVEAIVTAARQLHPDQLTWVVVGDRARIEKAIRELKIGEIELLSTDGSAQ